MPKNVFGLLASILLFSNLGIAQAKRINFTPTVFYNAFSLNVSPALHIQPGDTISTKTIDAIGRDENGIKRQRGGNPLTGPFYIDGAKAGDILVIELHKISLNRPYAYTTESFVSRSMPAEISDQFKKFKPVKWRMDIAQNRAWPDSGGNYPNLQNFSVELDPFLGCIGVAPRNKKNELLSFFQGEFGGNLDYSAIRQGSIVYLPVLHDGAFLYIGDGHALQGDGEIAGNALETSFDVEFSTRLIKNEPPLKFPRVEDKEYIMATGIAKKMDKAIQLAGLNLLDWLLKDYHLNLQEGTQVMSTTIEYTIAEIADPEIVIVAKIKRDTLAGLIKK